MKRLPCERRSRSSDERNVKTFLRGMIELINEQTIPIGRIETQYLKGTKTLSGNKGKILHRRRPNNEQMMQGKWPSVLRLLEGEQLN